MNTAGFHDEENLLKRYRSSMQTLENPCRWRTNNESSERKVPGTILKRKHDLKHADTARKRRSRMSIIADILRHTQSPARKTSIMYECNLSFNQLKRYLAFLKEKALIRKEADSGSTIYQTTNNGQKFLRRYSSITRLLSAT